MSDEPVRGRRTALRAATSDAFGAVTLTVAIILTNYRRPWNMPRILAECLRSARSPEIFLIDNGEDQALEGSPAIPFDRITYLRSPRNLGSPYRFQVAASFAHDIIVVIDDDIILAASQIDRLIGLFEGDPDRVHGIWGQECRVIEGELRNRSGITRVTREVEILNRVYACKPAHARAAIALSRRLGYASWDAISSQEDVLLSYAAPKKPMCHDLGPIEDCPTSNDPQIAVWLRPGFIDTRRKMVLALEELQAREGRPRAS